jgi:two-component system response regulator
MTYFCITKHLVEIPIPVLTGKNKMEGDTQNKTRGYISIVDDDSDDQFFLERALTEAGVQLPIKTFKNGVELINYIFLNAVKEDPVLPSLIITDLNMPKMGGKEILIRLKKHPGALHVPVIIYSTSYHAEEIEECYNLGANCYIAKPSSLKELNKVAIAINNFWLLAPKK